MRAGWEGNARLQDFVRRLESGAGFVAEALTVAGSEVIVTKTRWDSLTVSSGTVDVLNSGGVRILATESTLAEHTTDDGTDTTRLTNIPTFDALVIEHLGDGAESREFHTLTARLDPRADGGNPKTVDTWVAEIYRITFRPEVEADIDEIHVELVGRSDPVDAVGEVAADFDFIFEGPAGPLTGLPAEGGFSSQPLSLIRIVAFQADGTIADNVSWLSDSVQGSSKTDGSTYEVTHYAVGAAASQEGAQEGGSVWQLLPPVTNMPRFSLTNASFASAVVTATGASEIPDISGSGDLVIVARGEEWGNSSLLFEILGSSIYVTCVDGDVLGEDNRETIGGQVFGSDLTSVSTTGPWDIRVSLVPSVNGLRSPTAIDFGIERIGRTDLSGAARFRGGGRTIDPLTLKGNIPTAEIDIIKTGEKDYRDYGSELLALNHIGDIEIRVYVGDPSGAYLHRSEWMLHSTWDIEDYTNKNGVHSIRGVSPLRRLRIPIPPFEVVSGDDGTRKAIELSGTRKFAWDEIVDSFVGLPERFKGPGVEDTTNNVKKLIVGGDAKDELDRIAYLGGDANIESQGRIKAVKVMRDDAIGHITARFPIGSYESVRIGPGFGARTDEYFVRYNWEESDQRFENERRQLNAVALDKLGGSGLDTTSRLEEEAAKWIITEALADAVGRRFLKHFGNGLIEWEIIANERSPQLEIGDVVTIETEIFVARSPTNDQPIRGLVSATAYVSGIHGDWGRRLTLWVPGFEFITASVGTVTRTGQWERQIVATWVYWPKTGVAKLGTVMEGSEFIRAAFSTTEFPDEIAVNAESAVALDSDRYGEVTANGPFALDQELFISYMGYDEAVGGVSTRLFKVKSRRPTTTEPRVQADWDRTSSTTAALDLTIDDPTLSVTAVRFNKREGSEDGDVFTGFITTWDRSTGTIGVSTALTRGEDVLIEEGQESIIRWEVDFTDELGATQTIAGAFSSTNVDEHSRTVVVDHLLIQEVLPTTDSFRAAQYLYAGPQISTLFFRQSVTLPIGVEITNFRARMFSDNASAPGTARLRRIDSSDVAQNISAQLTWSNEGASWKSDAVSYTTIDEESYQVEISLDNNNVSGPDCRFYRAEITYTKPAITNSL